MGKVLEVIHTPRTSCISITTGPEDGDELPTTDDEEEMIYEWEKELT